MERSFSQDENKLRNHLGDGHFGYVNEIGRKWGLKAQNFLKMNS